MLKGTLHLVDLAGSERLGRSNASGDRLKETVAINKSLTSLTDVFVSISNKNSHVSWLDLTHHGATSLVFVKCSNKVNFDDSGSER